MAWPKVDKVDEATYAERWRLVQMALYANGKAVLEVNNEVIRVGEGVSQELLHQAQTAVKGLERSVELLCRALMSKPDPTTH